MNTIEKVLLWSWAIFSFALSCFISFVSSVFIALLYSEQHVSDPGEGGWFGEPLPTERRVILSDITGTLFCVIFVLSIIGFFAILINDAIFISLHKQSRRSRGFSIPGLWLFGLNMFILFLGPLVANVFYYLERAPFFPK